MSILRKILSYIALCESLPFHPTDSMPQPLLVLIYEPWQLFLASSLKSEFLKNKLLYLLQTNKKETILKWVYVSSIKYHV